MYIHVRVSSFEYRSPPPETEEPTKTMGHDEYEARFRRLVPGVNALEAHEAPEESAISDERGQLEDSWRKGRLAPVQYGGVIS